MGERHALAVVPQAAADFRRSAPARLDPGHVGQFVRDAVVAVDTGRLTRGEKAAVSLRRPSALLGELNRHRGPTVPALL
jgi:hypothetical protein